MATDNTAQGLVVIAGSGFHKTKNCFLNLAAATVVQTSATTQRQDRQFITLPVNTTRWRMRARNWNPKDGTLGTADVTHSDTYFGTPSFASATGQPNGAVTTALAIAGASMGTAGAQWVSAWCTDPTLQFVRNKVHAIVFAHQYTNGGTIAGGSGSARYSVLNGTAFSTVSSQGAPTGLSLQTTNGLDRQIEYEFIDLDGSIRRIVTTGDSTDVGYCSTSVPVFDYQGWVARVAAQTGYPIMAGGIPSSSSGDWVNNWATGGKGYYSRTGMYPDASLGQSVAQVAYDTAINPIGINDFAKGTNAAGLFTNVLTMRTNTLSCGITDYYMATVKPDTNRGVAAQMQHALLTVASSIGATSITTDYPATTTGNASLLSIDIDPGLAAAETVTASVSTGSGPYATTVPALANAHSIGAVVQSTAETQRQLYNANLRLQPMIATKIFDFDLAVRDPNAIFQYLAANTVDYTHQSALGNLVGSQTVLIGGYPNS